MTDKEIEIQMALGTLQLRNLNEEGFNYWLKLSSARARPEFAEVWQTGAWQKHDRKIAND
ncbi:hypothetical protein LCGC14_1461470 [marine sediment metagenome]|uniref:Uncharacterized protein n=1 Tax=marine sediment metagenome TaxID=412755 RepID=A0A0F9K127_9ZZZZ